MLLGIRVRDYRKMQISSSLAEASAYSSRERQAQSCRADDGALHPGDRELIRMAREAAGDEGEVAVSIFVNPLQFAPGGDYEKYPRPEMDDEEVCRSAGVDILFRPSADEMYANDFSVAIEENSLSAALCGKSRPGHFRGVCTVVAKLFHVLAPDADLEQRGMPWLRNKTLGSPYRAKRWRNRSMIARESNGSSHPIGLRIARRIDRARSVQAIKTWLPQGTSTRSDVRAIPAFKGQTSTVGNAVRASSWSATRLGASRSGTEA